MISLRCVIDFDHVRKVKEAEEAKGAKEVESIAQRAKSIVQRAESIGTVWKQIIIDAMSKE